MSEPKPRLSEPSALDNVFTWDKTASSESVQNGADSGFSGSNPTRSDPDCRSNQSLPSTIAQDIADQMRGALEASVSDDQDFLPYDRLCEILTFEVVSDLLQGAFEEVDGSIANFATHILGPNYQPGNQRNPPRIKIFAILVMMDKTYLVNDFISNDILDEHLPLKVTRTRQEEGSKVIVRLCKRSKTVDLESSGSNDILLPVKLSRLWSSRDMEDFESRQKLMCIPLFDLPCEKIQFYDLTKRPTLPFLKYEQPKVGGYGTVRKAEIHDAHCSHSASCKTKRKVRKVFAVKELHAESEDAYDQEMGLFRKIGARNESDPPKHLIQLQFSYQHGDRYFLVFPWASGNLREFWKKKHNYNAKRQQDMRWFFNQCRGLATGLQKVHTLTSDFDASKLPRNVVIDNITKRKVKRWGRHGDIKPENILWFEKYEEQTDFLVISDFGLTRFNTTSSKSKVRHESIVGYSGTYRPPELDLKGSISQRYDVWSLGCVFLEFVSWLLLGYTETHEDFTDSRLEGDPALLREDKFFILEDQSGEKPQAKTKPSVIGWINKLRSLKACTIELCRFLNYIEHDMLQPDPANRPDCGQIMRELDIILKVLGLCQPNSGSDIQNDDGAESSIRDFVSRASSFPVVSPEMSRAPSETSSRRAPASAYSQKRSITSTSLTSISSDTDGIENGLPSPPSPPSTPLSSHKLILAEIGSHLPASGVNVGNPSVRSLHSEALDPTKL